MLIASSSTRCSPANAPFIAIGIISTKPSSNTSHVRRTTIFRKTTTQTISNALSNARRSVSSAATTSYRVPSRIVAGGSPGVASLSPASSGTISREAVSSAATVPAAAPIRMSRPTSGSRTRPESSRVQPISSVGQKRRTYGSNAMYRIQIVVAERSAMAIMPLTRPLSMSNDA